MASEEVFLSVALNAWNSTIARAEKAFSGLSATQLLHEIAPGKNRLIYVWGHLTAVHDAMLPLLGFGPRLHPELDVAFLTNADKTQANIPSAEEVKKAWQEVNAKLGEGFAGLSVAEWLQKHSAVSAEDFVKEPLRNRYAILLGRTNHLGYHLGQVAVSPQ